MTAFSELERFAAAYPEASVVVKHRLADHPMFALDALVALASRMRPQDVEYNRGDLPLGIAFDDVPGNGLSIADTIRGIEENGSWMVLKFVEQDPDYRALLAETLGGLDQVVHARTGAMLKQEGFIFISSPNSVTPLHFDPEHNILLQLRGTKAMTIFPASDEQIAPPQEHEAFHRGKRHRNLPWNDDYATRGDRYDLQVGDGLYVPMMAPHFVKNGPAVSISFSVTWRSVYSYAEAEARCMNAVLRGIGAHPTAPRRYPARNIAKSFAYRAIRRIRDLKGAR